MRVLLVSQEFPPETGWGGIGTYVGVIAPALARAGAEVDVLSVVAGQEASDRELAGVRVHRRPLRRPRGVGRALRLPLTWERVSLATAVAREARRLEGRVDVCESPDWSAEGLGLALAGRGPLVVRLHSGAAQLLGFLGRSGLDARLAIGCERALIRRADLVTGTRAQLDSVGRPLGLDPAAMREITYPVEVVEPLAAPTEPARVLFAGRLERRKGADLLVRALPALLERVPEARAVLLGTDTMAPGGGSYAAELRRIAAELGIAGALEIAERWGRDALVEELRRATACAVPSRWESFGYVAAEALALGRPVVASRIPALADVVYEGRDGRLVPVDDPAALGESLADVIADPERAREMGLAGAKAIAERCDPDHLAAATLAAYEAAIARHGRRHRGLVRGST